MTIARCGNVELKLTPTANNFASNMIDAPARPLGSIVMQNGWRQGSHENK